jgi:hypothetical protein
MEPLTFRYRPTCSHEGCRRPARYKIAAPWSCGDLAELRNYGLACEEHSEELLDRAQSSRRQLVLDKGETLGEVGLYRLVPGLRDAELSRVS